MDLLLSKAFERLKKDSGQLLGRSKQTAPLRASIVTTNAALASGQTETADDYIEPLVLACGTKSPKLIITALDCLHKLIAQGYLRGSARNIPSADGDSGAMEKKDKKNKNKTVIPLSMVASSSSSSSSENGLSNNIHGVEDKDKVDEDEEENQDEGSRMKNDMKDQTRKEMVTKDSNNEEDEDEGLNVKKNVTRMTNQEENSKNEISKNKVELENIASSGGSEISINHQKKQIEEDNIGEGAVVIWSTLEIVVEAICKCKEIPNDDVQLLVVKILLTLMTTSSVELHEGALMVAVQASYHIHLTSRNQVNRTTASSTLSQIVDIVFQRMEAMDLRTNQKNDEKTRNKNKEVISRYGSVEPKSFETVLHKDAFLLFRALCKLSMRAELNSEATESGTSGVALQSKMVALGAVLSVLDKCGPTFRSSEKFIVAIRQFLCVSLLKNCTSLLPSVIDISLQIFVKLIAIFKDHLKAEIEVFIDKVFLPILDSENSSGEHKALVLEVFHTICQDPQALVEIFLNYDCNFENKDLFRRIIITLAKVAKGGKAGLAGTTTGSEGSHKKGEDIRVTNQLKALQALVSTTHSLTKSSINDPLSSGSEKDPLRPLLARRNTITSNSKLNGTGGDAVVNSEESNESEDLKIRNSQDSTEIVSEKQKTKSNSNLTLDNNVEDEKELIKSRNRSSSGADQASQGNAAVESFEVKKKQQEDLDDGVLKFNLNPKKGLHYLAETGHLMKPLDAKNIAKFLHVQQDKLDKTAIGELLGKEKDYMEGLCVKILHEYVDSMDFTNNPLDESIRHFLSGFRLPGEAQKIDRMMEKFAERFCVLNAKVFPSPDTAFVLSFSIIMLNTDLHNPAIADDRRMTKAGFRRQAEGIANGQNLEDAYLDAIYDRIKLNPISLKEDDQLRASPVPVGGGIADLFSSAATVAGRRKQEAYTKEREDIVRESQLMFNQVKRRQSRNYISLADLTDQHVRPMFEVAWGPILGVYVHVLDQIDDPNIVTLCLEGLKDCVRIAAVFDIPLVRDTLVNTLTKFTTLDTVREMQPKNIECIQHLLHLAIVDGDYLGSSWFAVLDAISQLARLQILSTGLTDDGFFHNVNDHHHTSSNRNRKQNRRASFDNAGAFLTGVSGSGSNHGTTQDKGSDSKGHERRSSTMSGVAKFFYGPTRAEAARMIEESNAQQVIEAIDIARVDYVFSASTRLSGLAIQEFVKALCLASLKELQVQTNSSGASSSSSSELGLPAAFSTFRIKDRDSDMAQPRIFSLQKLVEVADSNMPVRGRIIWDNIWKLLAGHFTKVACGSEDGYTPNTAVSLYAVDSLRQLSLKFLSKDEMAGFNFQRMFLEPFAVIMKRNQCTEVREMVLSSLNSLLLARAHNVRSGWRPIFKVFAIAGSLRDSDCEPLSQQAYNSVHRLVQSHFALLVNDFPELVSCLLSFARGPYTEMALGALNLIHHCAANLSTPNLVPSEGLANSNLLTRSSSAADSLGSFYSPTTKTLTSLIHPHKTFNNNNDDDDEDELHQAEEGSVGFIPGAVWVDDVRGVLPAEEVEKFPLLPLWWCILAGLSSLISDERLTVRSTALAQFEDILHHYGRRFSAATWDGILRGILFPTISNAIDNDASKQPISSFPSEKSGILSAAISARKQGSMDSWVATSARPTLSCLIRLFLEHLIPSKGIRSRSFGDQVEVEDERYGPPRTSTTVPSDENVTALNPKDDIKKDENEEDEDDEDSVLVNENDSVLNLISILPLILTFLEAIITNKHSLKSSPQSAELLARIGISILEECIDGLSCHNAEYDHTESNFGNTTHDIWNPIAECLCRLNTFALSTDLLSSKHCLEKQDLGHGKLANPTDLKNDSTVVAVDVEKNIEKNDDDDKNDKKDDDEEEDDEDDDDKTLEVDEEDDDDDDDNEYLNAEKEVLPVEVTEETMTKFVLALKITKLIRDLLDVEGVAGVGAFKKLPTSSSSTSRKTSISRSSSNVSMASNASSRQHHTPSSSQGVLNLPTPLSSSSSSVTSSSSSSSKDETALPQEEEEEGNVFKNKVIIGGTGRLSEESVANLLECLKSSASKAAMFNRNVALRTNLSKSERMLMPYAKLLDSRGVALGGSPTRPLPHLLEQEVLSYQNVLGVLLRILTGNDAESVSNEEEVSPNTPKWAKILAEPLIVEMMTHILVRYDDAEKLLEKAWFEAVDQKQVFLLDYETRSLAPAAAHCLKGILIFTDDLFLRHKEWFYPLVIALVTSNSRTIRSLVQKILSGPMARLVVLSHQGN